ncbi:MAG: DUF3108 domain-containing protein [Ignavibacteriaceae bacterium]|nr:DUF3108 domain-containing protein [Ignavibacteriaceae bacterium]
MKKGYFVVLLFLPFFFLAVKQLDNSKNITGNSFPFNSSKTLQVGDEFRYVVSYSFISLGEIKIKVTGRNLKDGITSYNAIGYIDSYSGLPFVDLHQVYETVMTNDYYSDFFRGVIQHKEYKTFTEYNFDYPASSVSIKKGKVKPYQLWTDSTTQVEKKYQDGLSILFYAMMNSGQDKTINLPCFVNEEKVNTKVNFYSKREPVEIDAVDYEIDCVRLDGHTDFVSVFGLTGNFEGWFTNDEVSVPVIAKMKVIIGNVTLELVEWKREGWKPPKYN